ncbi:MAG: hypothetical protein ACR2NO_04310 [Chloroflexota bacterium]
MATRREKVRAAIAGIRKLHATGSELLKTRSRTEQAPSGAVARESQRLGIRPDMVRKARQFADPAYGYTRGELDDLCRELAAAQANASDARIVFGVSHLVRLLSVAKNRRAALQRRAIKDGWSITALELEIAARYGTRKAGGRRRRIPRDPAGLLTQLEGMCEAWRRWHAAASASDNGVGPLAALPIGVRREITLAIAGLTRLHEVVAAQLATDKPGWAVRHSMTEAQSDTSRDAAKRSKK